MNLPSHNLTIHVTSCQVSAEMTCTKSARPRINVGGSVFNPTPLV